MRCIAISWFQILLGGLSLTLQASDAVCGETESDYFIERVEVRAGANVIREVADGVIWSTSGGCTGAEERTDFDAYPMSAPASATVMLNIRVNGCPVNQAPAEGISGNWAIEGTTLSGTFSGWDVLVPIPPEVGIFTLILDLGSEVSAAALRRKLLVTLHSNGNTSPSIGLPPRKLWYEMACQWAQSSTSEEAALRALLEGVYAYGGSNWTYTGNRPCTWDALLEGCREGDCTSFATVLQSLAKVMGIGALEQHYLRSNGETWYTPEYFFVTLPGAPSIDPAFVGNVMLRPQLSGFDRYVFKSHTLITHGGKFYDPTFKRFSSSDRDLIEFNVDNGDGAFPGDLVSSSWTTIEGATLYRGAGPDHPYRGWGGYELELPGASPPPHLPISRTLVGPTTTARFSQPRIAVTSASFHTEPDEGLARTLSATVGVQLHDAGEYTLAGTLLRGDRVVANSPRSDSSVPVAATVTGGAGSYSVELAFSGEQIFRSGLDGPYTLVVASSEATATFDTPSYASSEFGELDAALLEATATPVDTDDDGQFNELRVTAQVSVRQAGTFALEGALLNGGGTVATASGQFALQAGSASLELSFSSSAIHQDRTDGATELALSLHGDDLRLASYHRRTVEPLVGAAFDTVVALDESVADDGVDSDGDGDFDEMRVRFGADVHATGVYRLAAQLRDGSGEPFAFGVSMQWLGSSHDTIILDFPGPSIRSHQMDGPFILESVDVFDADGRLIERAYLDHVTRPYSYRQFDANDGTSPVTDAGVPDSSGMLDTSFGVDGKASSVAFGGSDSAMALQADGKIVMVGGTFVDFILTRFNPDGSPDTGFGVGGRVITDMGSGNRLEAATAVAIQQDGKIVVAGYNAIPTAPPAPSLPPTFALARYDQYGSLDTQFGSGGRVSGNVNGSARAVAIQPDGKIVVAGSFSFASTNGTDYGDFVVARFNGDGSLDASFGVDASGQVVTDINAETNSAENLIVQPDGAIVVSGTPRGSGPGFEHTDIARYKPDGSLDASFGEGGKVALAGVIAGEALARHADGKFVLAGNMTETTPHARARFLLMRLNPDGGVDGTFGNLGRADTLFVDSARAKAVAVQDDGKIVAVGSSTFAINTNFVVARYEADGAIDRTFDGDGNVSVDFFGYTDIGENVLIQPDGKLLVGGLARGSVNGYGLARLQP